MTHERPFIWIDPEGRGRNRYVLFRRSFVLETPTIHAAITLFADTRYRLIVNGQTVGHGPTRFYADNPAADTYDISTYLQPGENVLAVIVNSYGCVSFHSQRSRGGLKVRLRLLHESGRDELIVTDEQWRCLASPGHDPDMPRLTFALNPGEWVDLGRMPTGWDSIGFDDSDWLPAVRVDNPDHWGPIQPRPIPLLDETPIRPTGQVGTWAAAAPGAEDRYAALAVDDSNSPQHTQRRAAVLAYLHAPQARRVRLGSHWGQFYLNGERLEGSDRDDVFLRKDYDADLAAGWNTLLVYETMRFDVWDFPLALPAESEIAVRAERDLDAEEAFLVGGPWVGGMAGVADAAMPVASADSLPAELGPWRRQTARRDLATPCRRHAWRTLRPIEEAAQCPSDETLVLLFDFEREVLGRVRLDFTAAAGTTVEVAYTERRHDNGTANIHGRSFVEMVEGCTAGEGRQTWHAFHPRGFRYLELSVTGRPDAFVLHDLDVTGAYYPVTWGASFTCSDPRLSAIWELGRQALHNCMEDAFLDCPCRERGAYVGDALVEFDANLAAFGDYALMRRTIELFLDGQGDNGLVRAGAHGLPAGRHPDYSAILVLCARRYVEATGDASIVAERTSEWLKLLAGLADLGGRRGLLDGSDLSPYVDIARHQGRDGVSCPLNCFYQKAFADAAWLFAEIGEAGMATGYRQRAEALADAIRREFWDERAGVFVDLLPDEATETAPSVHSNALAVLFDIATEAQARRIEPWLVEAMADNFLGRPAPAGRDQVRVNAYFSYYALGALYKLGRDAEALAFIRTCWGHMLDEGAWTTWESFGGDEGGSLCHAWAASPTWYLTTRVLGVTEPESRRPDHILIDPHSSGLTWAKGVWPHRRGPIRVAWELRDGKLHVECEGPEGVEVSYPHAQ